VGIYILECGGEGGGTHDNIYNARDFIPLTFPLTRRGICGGIISFVEEKNIRAAGSKKKEHRKAFLLSRPPRKKKEKNGYNYINGFSMRLSYIYIYGEGNIGNPRCFLVVPHLLYHT